MTPLRCKFISLAAALCLGSAMFGVETKRLEMVEVTGSDSSYSYYQKRADLDPKNNANPYKLESSS